MHSPIHTCTHTCDPAPSAHSRGVDPRFDVSISGGAPSPQDLERQRKRYAFIYDDVLPKERAVLKQRLQVRVGSGFGCGERARRWMPW